MAIKVVEKPPPMKEESQTAPPVKTLFSSWREFFSEVPGIHMHGPENFEFQFTKGGVKLEDLFMIDAHLLRAASCDLPTTLSVLNKA